MSTKYSDLVTPKWVQCGFCKESLQVGVYKPRSCSCGQVFVEHGRAYYKLTKRPRSNDGAVPFAPSRVPVLTGASA